MSKVPSPKRIAFITGASSGLGAEFARQLDTKSDIDIIVLVARREDRLKALASELKHETQVIVADLAKEASELTVLAKLPEKSELAYLVLAAGYGKIGAVGEVSRADSNGMIDLNCRALVAMLEAALPRLAGSAQIYPIASVAAFLPQPDFATYAATKAFVLSYARAFSCERASREHDLRVVTVCPGPMSTEFFAVAAEEESQISNIKSIGVEKVERVVQLALKRGAKRSTVSLASLPMKFIRLSSRMLPHRFILWLERQIGLYR